MTLPIAEKDNLYFLYVTCNLSKKDIADIYYKKPRTIEKKLHNYGIHKPDFLHDFNTKKAIYLKYGVDNIFKLDNIKTKIKETNLNKYGCSSYTQTTEYKNKVQKTNISKYNTNWVLQNKTIKEKIKQTNLKKYGVTNVFASKQIQETIKNTNLTKYDVENPQQNIKIKTKTKNTLLKKYNATSTFTSPIIKEKIKKSLLEKYGVDNVSKNKEVINKIYRKKKENHTLNSSHNEEKIKQLLYDKFSDMRYQYKSKEYPFNCDFYIPCLNLYIEYQEHWSHGKHPFDASNIQDKLKVTLWNKKCTKYYKNAINTWTVRDPLKRKTAKDNGLNWIEFFTFEEFIRWFNAFPFS